MFPNAACIAAMLDRLLHHTDVTVIEGYRVHVSELEAAERRKRNEFSGSPARAGR